MVYDPDGIRVHKSVNGEATDYLIDSNRDYAQVVYEQGPAENLSYTFGLDLVGLNTATESYTYHTDALGSTRLLSDSSGSVADDVRYDAWGELLAGGASVENQYLYTGEQFDAELNKLYLRARYYSPESGRFTQMDEWQGKSCTPVTQNKYLYAHADPANTIDPSGHFGLVDLGVANTIRSELGSMQVDVGFSLINAELDSESPTAGSFGWGVIASLSPGVLKALSKTITSKFIGSGKVSFNKNFKPLPKEIDAGEFLASKEGARIYIRGGSGTKGADFFLNGTKWELKTLISGTANAVANNIKKSISKGNQGTRFVIDGRSTGLTHKDFIRGIENAIRDGEVPSQVKGILGGGQIVNWP